MAVTNNVLNAINVFSSTSVFNSNKGSVGANDLNFIKQTTAELATEGGGIIAQSLGTNGYVKFANGLILQWGYYEAASTLTVILPIAFSSVDYAITLSPKTKSDAFGHRWKDKTFTTFGVDRISGVSTPGNYHAFGW